MRRSRPIAALAILLLLGCWTSPTSADTPDAWHKVDVAKLYDAVVDTVAEKFFDEAKLKQLDWRARAQALRPAVLDATPDEAVRQINALLSELKTSHTALLTPDDYYYYFLLDIVGVRSDFIKRRFWGSGPYYPGTGAFTRVVDGRHFVDGVLEGSPADKAGLKYGDEILSVDGQPYTPIAAFRGKVGTTVALTVRRHAEAEPQRLEVAVVPIRPSMAFSEATIASARVIERDGRRIAYVHLWASHDESVLRIALGALEPGAGEKPLDFVVLDARGRVGGRGDIAIQNLERLIPDQKPYVGSWRMTTRRGKTQRLPLHGRSALLIDHYTRSAAEIMAHGFKRSGFGLVVGTPTAGAVSGGALYAMPGDLLLYVAVVGHLFDDQPLEGVGVTPDHVVERPLPYAGGADPVLEAAVKLLTERKEQPTPEK